MKQRLEAVDYAGFVFLILFKMAENKKAVIVYADWIDQFEYLTDEEAGKLIKHLFRYVNDLNPVAPDRFIESQFIPLKTILRRDLEKWEKTIEGRSRAGKASAEARKQKEQSQTNSTNVENDKQKATNPTVIVKDNDIVSDILLKKETKENIPSWIEFLTYGLEKEPALNHKALKNKYDAWVINGWKNGNDRPIKNWKSSLLQTLAYIEKDTLPKTNRSTLQL